MVGVIAKPAVKRRVRAMLAVFCLGLAASPAWARHTNQAIYEDTFDVAAGGASLTRATQEGMIFANPALLPWGAQLFHWVGLKNTLMVGSDSVNMARQAASGKLDNAEIMDSAFKSPVHMGMATSLSLVTGLFGFTGFARVEPDIAASRYGSTGLPEFRVRGDGYAGVAGSLAARVAPWLSLGLTTKYFYAAEPDISVGLVDAQSMNGSALRDQVPMGQGMGYDVGSLVFLQGRGIDYRWALKVDDVGGTSFTGTQPAFRQTISTGFGVTFHTNKSALHLAADYRDILHAYDESWFKRTYLGAKLTLMKWVGIGAGLYQGYPSYGLIGDMLLMRISLTRYTRELGDHPGVEPRGMYLLTMSIGW